MNILLTTGESMERLFNLDWQLLADSCLTLVSVLVLFGALSYFLFNPVRKMLTGRTEKIKNELDQAAADKKDAMALKEEYDAKLKNINKEADEIMEQARKKAKLSEEKIIGDAKIEAAGIIEKARKEAELEKRKASDDVKREIIAVATLMAGKVVSGAIDTTIQNEMVDETLKEMGESTWLS